MDVTPMGHGALPMATSTYFSFAWRARAAAQRERNNMPGDISLQVRSSHGAYLYVFALFHETNNLTNLLQDPRRQCLRSGNARNTVNSTAEGDLLVTHSTHVILAHLEKRAHVVLALLVRCCQVPALGRTLPVVWACSQIRLPLAQQFLRDRAQITQHQRLAACGTSGVAHQVG